MMNRTVKSTPYWWEAAPLAKHDEMQLPGRSDVVIVGAGITAMCAAIPLLRAGRSVTIVDAGEIGSGASTRNAGYVSRSFKHSFADLERKHGLEYAIRLYAELQQSVEAVRSMVQSESIDCDLKMIGRFMPAPTTAAYDALAKDLEAQRKHLGFDFEMIPRERVRDEIATDIYQGGALLPDLGGLHPGKYHAGLLESAKRLGAVTISNTPVRSVKPSADSQVRVRTSRGEIIATDVIIATNGYTDVLIPWLRRRIIPFDAHMISTAALAPELVKRIIPNGRVCIDTNHNPFFVRPSPDGTRLLFGALTGERPDTPEQKGERLRTLLRRLLPDLDQAEIEYSWTGRCSGTFDLYPHMGTHQGIHYSVGYCFVGVPMGTYLGGKLAAGILGRADAATVFRDRGFPTVPLYSERPWFLPAVFGYYRFLDKRTPAGALAQAHS